MSVKVFPLKDTQALAVAPQDSVWLSASAGTGKTQVLSARVLRLLLEKDVRPEQILCLTFTKAGAAEMATRVNAVLAGWVRLSDTALAGDLIAIGARNDPATIARARSLFASVLDCPGGGLRIDTIHAFAQWLLSAFPEEAGLVPGTRAMEDHDREALAQQVLTDQLTAWERSDPAALAALEMLSLEKDPAWVRGWLARCAAARALWFGPGAWQAPMESRVKRLIGLGADVTHETIAGACAAPEFQEEPVVRLMQSYARWNTKTGQKYAEAIANWLALDGAGRAADIEALVSTVFTPEGVPKNLSQAAKKVPDIAQNGAEAVAILEAVSHQKRLLDLAGLITPALELGRKYALAWDEAKARAGLVDFDDLIARAADLLSNKAMSDWIRYKMDRDIDHVLVDEAQDTNAAQWSIINALTDDFFVGEGQAGNRNRSIFVVGDYKQAIFGFQGTSPQNFAKAKLRYAELLGARHTNAHSGRGEDNYRPLQDLPLGRSFRTSQPILSFVDQAIAAIGYENIGLETKPAPHIGDTRAGRVTLWQPVPGQDTEGNEDDAGLRLTPADRRMADRIALQIRQWLKAGYPLEKPVPARNATPGDIMVLVRKRAELANLIVARLYAAGVPVAGVDRLRLGAPLAVNDLLAALRFCVQPADDLSLACLLVSPLIGWSQEQLLAHGYREGRMSLWRHLQDCEHPEAKQVVAQLKELLALADFEPPQALLHWLLVGPWRGRAKLIARLGGEAGDPIDELLNAAHQFAASQTPSLQGFIHWFDSNDADLKREAEGSGDVVRVMTVHGAKGLQAPIVILADACGDPERARASDTELIEAETGLAVPIPSLSKDQRLGRIETEFEAGQARDLEEHWRLLYVAMTRAEEALFIGGALGKKAKEPPAASWYAALAPLFTGAAINDDIFGERFDTGTPAKPVSPRAASRPTPPVQLPAWATQPIGEEPRPPRPLAPSGLAEDLTADPPLSSAQAAIAARRGVLLHSLLERLPDVPDDLREAAGRAWLDRQALDIAVAERSEMLMRALDVLRTPAWEALFGPDALGEVPLAATVGGEVIYGIVDRLLVEDDRILVVDFKTARRPPADVDAIPAGTIKQMAAYVAALEVIYPGHAIEAGVLYTQRPELMALPASLIEAQKPGLTRKH